MSEAQILFPIDPKEFWKQLRFILGEVVKEQNQKKVLNEPIRAQEKSLLKVKEVCQIFKISKPTLYDWMHTGKLPSIKIGSNRFFHPDDVQALIDIHKVLAAPLKA